ncbi:M20 metallopeptidase family protein [Alkaliphilus serpentinus]|uniref:Amidohydrolase n=1 Tax=Alkaliphilus serpentinus TaxID=1482731 RepID=A0A833HMM4_9FIRM|nr:M20 family metallopeptidase [Alkaliphilus serpentinus]KAB3528820.1 amidohydrolase [Alkaliphilus serpentinus]
MKFNTADLYKEVLGIFDWLIEIRRDFHRNPELSTKETRTKEKIIEYLKEMGIEYSTFINHHGVVAIIHGSKGGKTIGLRADMDALPMEDLKKTPYSSSKKGVMHSCGHDAHMTILLGAAKILNNHRDSLSGKVKLIFQPAEETIGGAKPMIEDGVLENPKVEAIFGLHVSSELPVGKIALRYGQMNAQSDTIGIKVKGTSSHGAYPHGGHDSIVIAAHIISALQTIIARDVDPRDSAVISLGTISGGAQNNILAEMVEMGGTVRTINPTTREMVLKRVQEVVTGVATSLGGEGHLNIEEGYIALINHDPLVKLVEENSIEFLGKENTINISKVSLGVEDFAYFTEALPGVFFVLGSGNPDKGIVHCGHTQHFDIDEDCLKIGVMMQILNTLKALGGKIK